MTELTERLERALDELREGPRAKDIERVITAWREAKAAEPDFAALREAFGDALFAEGTEPGSIYRVYQDNIACWIRDNVTVLSSNSLAALILRLMFDRPEALLDAEGEG